MIIDYSISLILIPSHQGWFTQTAQIINQPAAGFKRKAEAKRIIALTKDLFSSALSLKINGRSGKVRRYGRKYYRTTAATSTEENGQPPVLGGWPSSCFISLFSPKVYKAARETKTLSPQPSSRERAHTLKTPHSFKLQHRMP